MRAAKKRISLAAALLSLLAAVLTFPAFAIDPQERLPDQALEARARALSAELRCLVCQNQSIDDSDAPLAKDLRTVVRQRLAAGDGDREVMDYVVARYGEFVLLKPRFALHTVLLWLAPLLLLLAGLYLARGLLRNQKSPGLTSSGTSRLSASEQEELNDFLKRNERAP